MGHSYFILGILFLTIVAPMWISAHYGTRWRKSRGLSREDEKTMAELWDSARRLEDQLEIALRVCAETDLDRLDHQAGAASTSSGGGNRRDIAAADEPDDRHEPEQHEAGADEKGKLIAINERSCVRHSVLAARPARRDRREDRQPKRATDLLRGVEEP